MNSDTVITYLILTLAFFVLELIYFKVADKFNIIDKPNERSSHTTVTIRGGGIVYVFAALYCAVSFGFQQPYLWIGFLLISIVSFVDDIVTLSSKVRMPIQMLGVGLLLFQALSQQNEPIWLWLVALILATGIINAYNFMDGINGITVGYSAIVLFSLYFLNQAFSFVSPTLIIAFILANLVFGFFNFRKKAKAFAGDVGSVAIAFILVFLLLKLMLVTQSVFYIMLLAVYGADSVLTILYRLKKGENILEAHRSHLYQWLVKPGPFSHLQMAGIYMGIQSLVSLGVYLLRDAGWLSQLLYSVSVLLVLALVYAKIKHVYKVKFGLS